MRWMFLVAAAVCASWSARPASAAGSTPGDLARTMLVAFQCGQYAGFAKMRAEQNSLYSHGVDTGRKFIKAVRDGKLTEQDAREKVPMIVGWMVRDGGPSDDFMLGRIFEAIASDASDDIIKRDASGMLLAPERWVTDSGLQQSLARTKYDKANCWAVVGTGK